MADVDTIAALQSRLPWKRKKGLRESIQTSSTEVATAVARLAFRSRNETEAAEAKQVLMTIESQPAMDRWVAFALTSEDGRQFLPKRGLAIARSLMVACYNDSTKLCEALRSFGPEAGQFVLSAYRQRPPNFHFPFRESVRALINLKCFREALEMLEESPGDQEDLIGELQAAGFQFNDIESKIRRDLAVGSYEQAAKNYGGAVVPFFLDAIQGHCDVQPGYVGMDTSPYTHEGREYARMLWAAKNCVHPILAAMKRIDVSDHCNALEAETDRIEAILRTPAAADMVSVLAQTKSPLLWNLSVRHAFSATSDSRIREHVINEISAQGGIDWLVSTLHETPQRLSELTQGESNNNVAKILVAIGTPDALSVLERNLISGSCTQGYANTAIECLVNAKADGPLRRICDRATQPFILASLWHSGWRPSSADERARFMMRVGREADVVAQYGDLGIHAVGEELVSSIHASTDATLGIDEYKMERLIKALADARQVAALAPIVTVFQRLKGRHWGHEVLNTAQLALVNILQAHIGRATTELLISIRTCFSNVLSHGGYKESTVWHEGSRDMDPWSETVSEALPPKRFAFDAVLGLVDSELAKPRRQRSETLPSTDSKPQRTVVSSNGSDSAVDSLLESPELRAVLHAKKSDEVYIGPPDRIRFACAKCKKKLAAPESMAGRQIRCPSCKVAQRVPPGLS